MWNYLKSETMALIRTTRCDILFHLYQSSCIVKFIIIKGMNISDNCCKNLNYYFKANVREKSRPNITAVKFSFMRK